MSGQEPGTGLVVDRREFLGTAFAIAGVSAAALVPVIDVAAAVTGPERDADRHVDDQWSGFPRYADPIGFGRRAAPLRPRIDPVDEQFAVF